MRGQPARSGLSRNERALLILITTLPSVGMLYLLIKCIGLLYLSYHICELNARIFSSARISHLNISRDAPSSFESQASPGEGYWYRQGHYRIGMPLHQACMIPAGLLMVWQFLPIIRHKAILYHPINNYVIIVIDFIGNISALMIARRAFGEPCPFNQLLTFLVIMVTYVISMAFYNVMCLQIDQLEHRC